VTSLEVLSKYLLIMELRFGARLFSNLANENSDAVHIKCSRGSHLAAGHRSPTSAFTWHATSEVLSHAIAQQININIYELVFGWIGQYKILFLFL